ncbi:MAG: hypothetical protein K2G63_07220, partial [Oscillospiraceae bacterium]|nr:hypothetical protein [Oscillospiraceae bacterium]
LNDEYKNRVLIFKEISINRIGEIINIYWNHLFSCDYLLYIYNIVKGNVLLDNPCFRAFKKCLNPPVWNTANFYFTKSLDNWNESNTLKYCGVSIGEFQAHNNRNCLKFRFNLDGIVSLLNEGIISYN